MPLSGGCPSVTWFCRSHIALLLSCYFPLSYTALPSSCYFATCHASLPLMLMFCHSHTAVPVRLPASLTLLLYYHADCRCHPTVRLPYFLATLRLLPTVILLCQSCCMPSSCMLLYHYHASCHSHATVLLSSDLQSSLILLCRSHTSFLWSYCFATIMLLLPLSGCLATHAAALPMPYRFAGRNVGRYHSTLPQSCCSPLSCYLATIKLLRDCQGTLPLSCCSVTVILLR